jgi:hypothetical protein
VGKILHVTVLYSKVVELCPVFMVHEPNSGTDCFTCQLGNILECEISTLL